MARTIDADALIKSIIQMPPDGNVFDRIHEAPTIEPEAGEDCDTCVHGYFGDRQCDNCRVGYPSHYERRTGHESD